VHVSGGSSCSHGAHDVHVACQPESDGDAYTTSAGTMAEEQSGCVDNGGMARGREGIVRQVASRNMTKQL
jgi:hypothetical protein